MTHAGPGPRRGALAACATLAAALVFAGCDAASGPSAPVSPAQSAAPASGGTGCGRTSVGLTPLNDLGTGSYKGQMGGLYPGGGNARPASHESAGLTRARAIVPMDRGGVPDPAGRYVLVSIGMSNTTQEFSAFKALSDPDPARDRHLTVVDGAQGGQTAQLWSSPGCPCWATLNDRLTSAGVTAAQVTVAWIKQADSNPTTGWPAHVKTLQDELAAIVSIAGMRFPNLKLIYLSSRIYAGYATTTLNPEPYAYEGAFAVKGLIDEQLRGTGGLGYSDGPVGATWMAWGPYLWADGLTPRSDGLSWACGDLSGDGTHPSSTGQRKVAEMLLAFFQTDTTARAWYLAR